MIKKVQQLLATAATAVLLMAPGIAVPVLAGGGVASADIATNICTGANAASSSTGNCTTNNKDAGSGLTQLAQQITKWFSIIVGAISIIMIIYGGFRYITSGGDSGKVGSAKNTLIYAVIGLIIVALAQLIVNVVLTQAGQTTSNFS